MRQEGVLVAQEAAHAQELHCVSCMLHIWSLAPAVGWVGPVIPGNAPAAPLCEIQSSQASWNH